MFDVITLFIFCLLLCNNIFVSTTISESSRNPRRLHSIVSVTPSKGKVEAKSLFAQNIQRIATSPTTDRNDALIIEIDQLDPIHIVPMCPEYQNFAVTVKDRVLYKCELRPSGTPPTPILMHLFLENDVLKIAQSQDSMCSDRRKLTKSKITPISSSRWQPG